MKFREWVDEWLVNYKEPFVGKATLDTIGYCLNHILPAFGDKELGEIKGIEIQRFINSLAPIPNMQDKCRKYLQDILEYAYRNRYIEFNPMLAVKFRTYHTTNTDPLTKRQRDKFIKSLEGKKYKLLYLAYLYTGARLSEIITPGRFEVDFNKKLVYIHGTKTEKSDRVMPLFDKLAEALKEVPNYKEYFCSYTRNYVYLRLQRHLEQEKIKPFSVRALRCTFSLMCYELGIRETTIQAWLGHTTTKTTKNYYLSKERISTSESVIILGEVDKINGAL